MKIVIMALAMISLAGCVSAPPRAASVSSLPTKKAKPEAFAAMTKVLASNGWRIKTVDKDSGIISTEPQQFFVPRGVMRLNHNARSSLQLLYLGDSVQLQMTHECEYPRVSFATAKEYAPSYQVCASNDSYADEVLPAREALIAKMIKDAL